MNEALRIEQAFSRYRDDNLVFAINHGDSSPVPVDDEMARMLDFAQTCYQTSDGAFDITSGILGKCWQFDGSDSIPEPHEISELLPLVGWDKVTWEPPFFCMPKGMQIDFGGIGKEYAVDRSVALLNAAAADTACLVNYGGDLAVNRAPRSKSHWHVGVEAAREAGQSILTLELQQGALASSGDARRYLEKDGTRYGHVIHPLTGWPVHAAPASVTVAGDSCLQAGVLSTLAILQGASAERFLDEQGVLYWCQR